MSGNTVPDRAPEPQTRNEASSLWLGLIHKKLCLVWEVGDPSSDLLCGNAEDDEDISRTSLLAWLAPSFLLWAFGSCRPQPKRGRGTTVEGILQGFRGRSHCQQDGRGKGRMGERIPQASCQGLFTHWCQAFSSESPNLLPWQGHLPPQGSQRRWLISRLRRWLWPLFPGTA